MKLKKSALMLVCASALTLSIFSCKKEAETQVLPAAGESSSVQTEDKSCEAVMFPDAAAKSRFDEMERTVQARIAQMSSTAQRPAIVTIPVVFHVVYNLAEQNISDAQLQSQVDALNEDFTKTNADITTAPSY